MSNPMASKGRPQYRDHHRARNSGGMNPRSNNNPGGRRSEPREPRAERAAPTGVHANPRLMNHLMHVVGHKVMLTTRNGQKYTGLFTAMNNEGNVILSVASCVDEENPNAPASQDLGNMVIEKDAIVSIEAKGVELDAGREFVTDSVIAQRANGQVLCEKELQPWDGGDDAAVTQETLEASDANGWTAEDMFQCNEEKFCLISSYNKEMNEYTTPLPSVKDETYRKREQEAARKAREIEDSEQSRRRYELENGDEDEEAKFSAVHRPGGGGGMRDLGPGKSKGSQGYMKRSGGMGSRGGRQQHMDGGRGLQQARSGAQALPQPQPPTSRSPPKMDTSNPPRVNGSRNEAHTAEMSRSLGEMPATSASGPSTLAQGPGPQSPQSQPPQSTPSPASSQLPPQPLAAQAPSAGSQVRSPLPPSHLQSAPSSQPLATAPTPSQAPSQAACQAVSTSTAAMGGGDAAQEATTSSQATATAGVSRNNRAMAELKDFHMNLNIKYNEDDFEGEAAGAGTPKEASSAAKEDDSRAERTREATGGEKPTEKKKFVLNPNAEEFKPQSKPMPPPAASQAPTPPRPSLPQSPSVMMAPQQSPYMANYMPYGQATMNVGPPQSQPNRNHQYPKRAVVSMTQASRQEFSITAQQATGVPLMANATPQFNQPYIMPPHHFTQQNVQMLPAHHSRVMNPTSMALSHQSMQPGSDPMQASSPHAVNQQHMFMAPPHPGPIPAHLQSHIPMPAHVSHAMATGQQSQAMQQMTPVTGPPNPGSVQHNVGHQQPPPTSGTPQPGQMSYAQINLPSHLGHQNQHTTSPQPMQPYGMATSHAQPQQHLQHGHQYTFTQQSQPTSSQAMQPYGSSQPGQHPPTLVMMPQLNHLSAQQFGGHHPMPMPAHANATPVMPVHSGIPVSAASSLSHPHHMPFLQHPHSQVPSQHAHQVPNYHQAQ